MKHSIIKSNRKKIYYILFWIVLWQIFSMIIHQDLLFASPISVIKTFTQLIQKKEFYFSIAITLIKIGAGFFIGFLLGILFGITAFFFTPVKEFLAPLISLMKSIPIASFIILVLVWMSSKQLSIFISFFVVFPTIYIGVLEGFSSTRIELLEMAYVYRMKWTRKVRYLYLPDSFPMLISASKIALGMCWKAGIAAEIIGTPKYSIGAQLYMAKIYLSTSELFAWTLVLILLSILFEKIVLKMLLFAKKRLE